MRKFGPGVQFFIIQSFFFFELGPPPAPPPPGIKWDAPNLAILIHLKFMR